jgi:menaquinone-9 beta-reductase
VIKEYDIIIVGSGPAGASCALQLADSGLRIAVTDKAVFPRDKTCGDALSGNVMNVLKKLPGGIYDKFLNNVENKLPSWGIKFIAPNHNNLDIPFLSNNNEKPLIPPGFICKRIDFDNFLFQQLKSYKNIDIYENCEIKSIKMLDRFAEAESNNDTFLAKLIVGADGAYSVLRKSLSDESYKTDKSANCLGLRAYYENVTGFNKENYIELYFLKDILPGYFWIFPMQGNAANVGIGMLSDYISKRKINLKSVMLDIIKNHPLIAPRFKNAKLIREIKGYPLPLGTKKNRISGKRFILTGDSASLIDPFTGEGVGNAMQSGYIAAEQIIECFTHNDFSETFIMNYDKRLYSKIWQELRISRTLQNLSKYSLLFNLVVNKANKNDTLKSTIIKMINNTDLKNELTKPSFYFKILFN